MVLCSDIKDLRLDGVELLAGEINKINKALFFLKKT